MNELQRVWGHPKAVAEAALNETFRIEGFDLDHDGQVNTARDIGILAGLNANKTPEDFLNDFRELINAATTD